MRIFEIILGLLNAASLLIFSFSRMRSKRLSSLFPVLPMLVLLLHLFIEQYRWQMVPLYLLSFVLLVFGLWLFFTRKKPFEFPRWLRIFSVGAWILLLVGILLPILMPVPRLLIPAGPYAVGTDSFYWVDESRDEIYAETDEPMKRRLMVQVWYPAALGPDSEPADYVEAFSGIQQGVGQRYQMPTWIAGYLKLIETHTYHEAPLIELDKPFPVLVFSHGWTGFRTQNTYQMEEMASHGYVVISVDHTYGAMATVFPDGELVLNNPDALPSGVSAELYQQGIDKLGDTWAGDLAFVLDQLEHHNRGEIVSIFTGKLDLSQIGMFGHSTGGGAVVEVCCADSRCQAGLAMDAWLEPYSKQMAQQGLEIPFMFLESELWNQDVDDLNPDLFKSLYENMTSDVYLLKIAGARHTDFADLPSLTPMFFLLRAQWPWYGRQILENVNVFTLAFFDQYLRGASSGILDQALTAYPEVTVQRR